MRALSTGGSVGAAVSLVVFARRFGAEPGGRVIIPLGWMGAVLVPLRLLLTDRERRSA